MKEVEQLMQIDRSITGDGVRNSLEILRAKTPFEIHEIPSGTQVFDWVVPQEWVIRDAILIDEGGKVWADYKKDFLHVVSYSEPIDKEMTYEELEPHLHTAQIGIAVPYRTSYYERNWGISITKNAKKTMNPNLRYHVKIDSEFKDGSLTYGERTIEGDGDEYIISTYCCHPNLINDNTAGMVMWADLLSQMGKTKHTYRFVIAPETIGMISYLATHDVSRVKGALIISHTIGQTGDGVQFKRSFLGDSYMDRVARLAIGNETPFSVVGSDERQLSSPSFRIPTILVNRGGLFQSGYHTSMDRDFNIGAYKQTLNAIKEIVASIEGDRVIESLNPHGEPMLGKRNLYPNLGGDNQGNLDTKSLLSIMFYSGSTLLDVSEKTGIPMSKLAGAADILQREGLIK